MNISSTANTSQAQTEKKKIPKGNALIRLIGDQFYRNPDEAMNVSSGVYLGDIYEEFLLLNMSRETVRILMQISSIIEYKGKRNKNGEIEIQVSAQYISNGMKPKFYGKKVDKKHTNAPCIDTIYRALKILEDTCIKVERNPTAFPTDKGWCREKLKIVMTDRGSDLVALYRILKFEPCLFPKRKQKHHKYGMQNKTWEQTLFDSKATYHTKKKALLRFLRNCGGSFKELMNTVYKWRNKLLHRQAEEEKQKREQLLKKNACSAARNMSEHKQESLNKKENTGYFFKMLEKVRSNPDPNRAIST